MTANGVVLSVKQPWAALLAAGVKTVEVRTWPTARRGTVFLHAAKVPDDRPHGWTFIGTPTLIHTAELAGGVIAVGELVDCIEYPDAEAFAADAARHRNLRSWFRPPRLYGFVFADVRPVPFRAFTGKTFFFRVSVAANVPSQPPRPAASPSAECGTRNAELEDHSETPHFEFAVPHSMPRVIIIDPPEGKEAHHERHPPDSTVG